MNEEIQALNNALKWIREQWIGKETKWSGEIHEVVGACDHDSPLTSVAVKRIWEALLKGEPIESGGFMIEGEKVTVFKTDIF